MFDVAKLDAATGADKGSLLTVTHPGTKQPALDDDGKPITLRLFGGYSRQAEEARSVNAEKRADLMLAGIKVPREVQEGWNADFLAACTGDWSFDQLDGQPFPYSPDNAKRLWRDRRFGALAEQALTFIAQPANFMTG